MLLEQVFTGPDSVAEVAQDPCPYLLGWLHDGLLLSLPG
jgi:hypothetical protein